MILPTRRKLILGASAVLAMPYVARAGSLSLLGAGKPPAAGGGTTLLTGIQAYWKFDENTGTTAADATGNGNTGTLHGTAGWDASGKINSALSLPVTTTDYVSAGTGPSLSSFSISAWVKPTDFTNFYPILARSNVAGDNRNFELDIAQTNGKPRVVFTSAASTYQVLTASTALSTGVWSHVVGTFDGSTLSAYINGSAAGTLSAAFTPTTAGSQVMTIGVLASAGAASFPSLHGSIDELGLWNRALTSTEVTTLYASGSGLQYPF